MVPQHSDDTIAAIASGSGKGAIGIIRLSGSGVCHVAREMLGRVPAARRAELADFRAADGIALDAGLALFFPAPASFTGEDMLELHGHGGPVVLDEVLRRVLQLGARAARPGEFSERAFLNGKIDVVQAEAVADLIDACTGAAARAAVRSLQGVFSARVHELLQQLTELRAYVEAAIDFPDEDIDFPEDGALAERLARLFGAFDSLWAAARQGSLLREGLNVVIAGKPNAGKSSLMNLLAGTDVAIVTELPGTTRDVLRESVQLDGIPLHLIDTAGLREAPDRIEAEGIRRAEREMRHADRLLYLVDATTLEADALAGGASKALSLELAQLPPGIPVTVVFNKIDLLGLRSTIDTAASPVRMGLSAKTGDGIDMLRSHLKSVAGCAGGEEGALSARRRHLDALERARAHVTSAADALLKRRAAELFAEDLRLAQRVLGEITGEFTSDDLLGKIFASFCIGK
ncbi:MAG: tRNA uridine-5-carboxymethylaminomethyl(34) synthesis GTPase MnmE [Steroidobacterales bacterium]